MQVCLLCALNLKAGNASGYTDWLFRGLLNNCMDLFSAEPISYLNVMRLLRCFFLESVITISLGNTHIHDINHAEPAVSFF